MHGVVMAAIRWQLVYATHDQLPFLAMRLNARAEHLVSDEMGNFMGHCLAQKVVGSSDLLGQFALIQYRPEICQSGQECLWRV